MEHFYIDHLSQIHQNDKKETKDNETFGNETKDKKTVNNWNIWSSPEDVDDKKDNEKSLSELVSESESGMQITPEESYKIAYKLYDENMREVNNQESRVSESFYNDLEIFAGNKTDKFNTIFQQLDQTHGNLSKVFLQDCIARPTYCTKKIKNRQIIVRQLEDNPQIYRQIKYHLKCIKETEDDVLWFWKDRNNEIKQLFSMVYFNSFFLKQFNDHELILKWYNYLKIIIYPIYGLISPFLWLLIPYLVTRYWMGLKIGFWTYLKSSIGVLANSQLLGLIFSGLSSKFIKLVQYGYFSMVVFFYVYGVYVSFDIAIGLNKIINMIHCKVNKVAKYVSSCHQIWKLSHQLNLPELKWLDDDRYKVEREMQQLWDTLFQTEPYLLSNKGLILNTFYNLDNQKDNLIPLMKYVSQIDIHCNIYNLIHQSDVPDYNYCLVDINSSESHENASDKAYLFASGLWNPCMRDKNMVKNDIEIDGDNLIITGANASGKSTFIKSLSLSILLSQTLGIAPVDSIKLQPFHYLNTYLNIPDTKGEKSLFQAEMERVYQHMNIVAKMPKEQRSFIVMDEIFNSTNYFEGVSGAYAIGKKLAQYDNNVTIITTHYPYLTKLEEEVPSYVNYHFSVDEKLQSDYKIKKGTSGQNVALELLKLKGFDNTMINDAKKVYQELTNLEKDKKEDNRNEDNNEDKNKDSNEDSNEDENKDENKDSNEDNNEDSNEDDNEKESN